MVPVDRAPGWLRRFTAAHGSTRLVAAAHGHVRLSAADGARAVWSSPTLDLTGGAAEEAVLDPGTALALLAAPRTALVLLLRRGGAVAGVVAVGDVPRTSSGPRPGAAPGAGDVPPARVLDSRVRTARVQSRTAAGGWSQQRFARRRAGQASGLARDAAGSASLVWRPYLGACHLLAVGGDRALLEEALEQLAPDVRGVLRLARQELTPSADPRRRVLEEIAGHVGALHVEVTDP